MQVNFTTQPSEVIPLKTPFVEKTDNVQLKIKKDVSASKPVQSDNKPAQSENKSVKDDELKNLQNSLAEDNITLKFRQDEKTKQLIVELVNEKTGESIIQIPSEVSIKLSQMSVKIQGQFVDDKV